MCKFSNRLFVFTLFTTTTLIVIIAAKPIRRQNTLATSLFDVLENFSPDYNNNFDDDQLHYDQRQRGEENLRFKLDGFFLGAMAPREMPSLDELLFLEELFLSDILHDPEHKYKTTKKPYAATPDDIYKQLYEEQLKEAEQSQTDLVDKTQKTQQQQSVEILQTNNNNNNDDPKQAIEQEQQTTETNQLQLQEQKQLIVVPKKDVESRQRASSIVANDESAGGGGSGGGAGNGSGSRTKAHLLRLFNLLKRSRKH